MEASSEKENIGIKWLKWQFWEAPLFILKAWNNFLKFGLNYFSVPLLIKTFFSPWRRYYWGYPRGFDPWAYFESFFSNLIFRILGAIFRSVMIVVGTAVEILILAGGLLVFLAWFALPVFLIWAFFHGMRLFFY